MSLARRHRQATTAYPHDLNDYAGDFQQWLQSQSQLLASSELPYLADLAKLEWLHLALGTLDDPACLHVKAPMAPGLITRVAVSDYARFSGRRSVRTSRGVFAFDGERELAIDDKRNWEVQFDPQGPLVVDGKTLPG